MYGALGLFSAFVLYDTQKIIHAAKNKQRFCPIDESFHIYYDTIIIFQQFLMIFMSRKNK